MWVLAGSAFYRSYRSYIIFQPDSVDYLGIGPTPADEQYAIVAIES